MTPSCITDSPQATFDYGRSFGQTLKGGEIILLNGDLGSGKTLFTKGVAAALEAQDQVVSPSFTLVNVYKARLDIVHVDLYRLDADGIWGLGLEDYMDDGHIIIVEWADIAGAYFPASHIDIRIEYIDLATRRITIGGYDSL